MSDTKLKPCPFCGSEAYSNIYSENRFLWEVGCSNLEDKCLFAPNEVADTEALAVSAWNTRYTPSDSVVVPENVMRFLMGERTVKGVDSDK